MNNLKLINENNIKRNKAREESRKVLDKRIEELNKLKDSIKYLHIIDSLKPFLLKVQKKLKAACYEVYGPFGLCAATSFYFLKDKKDRDICKDGNVLGCITIVSYGDGWALRDESKETKRYANGTIGELNGMNYETIPFTNEMDLNWVVKWARRQR